MSPLLTDAASISLATFGYALLSGLLPFLNVEAYLLSVSALMPDAPLVPVVLAASAGQMTAKGLLYLSARALPAGKGGGAIQRLAERLARGNGQATALVFVSAVAGLPPFYAVSLAAGLLRFRLDYFMAAGVIGRLLRFAAVFVLPRLIAIG